MTSKRLLMLSAMLLLSTVFSNPAQAQHPSADGYWGYALDPVSGVIQAYTVTEGSMSLS
jgi:hypothetical protein